MRESSAQALRLDAEGAMRVHFHGAAGEVTGSMHEVEFNGQRILLDCGMIQGSERDEQRNEEDFPFDINKIDAVLLSHAHIDHCGRLPLLVRRGYRGPIWTQHATADLIEIMLLDSASLAAMDAERDNKHRKEGHRNHEPLYTERDVAKVMKQIIRVEYRETREILPGLNAIFRDAGHILGAASIELRGTVDGKTRVLVFSGDIGPKHTPILCDPETIDYADLVMMESTYGGRVHRSRDATVEELGGVLEEAWNTGGNVLVPAFAVGRSQELLYWFAKYWHEWNMSRWQIFLDSPMAAKVVEVYDEYEHLFDAEARKVWKEKPHPFRLPNLHYTPDAAQSKAINQVKSGAIIIAGSGMCNGGRIRHHLRQRLGNRNNHIVFVGYQGVGTLGRLLVDGVPSVRLFGEEIQVRAQRHTIGSLSAHADEPGLLEWYSAFKNKPPVVFVHGEDEARHAIASSIQEKFGSETILAVPVKVREV
jgi:metallo-beta-lactamase family protein